MVESTVKENRTLEELFQELDGMMRQMEDCITSSLDLMNFTTVRRWVQMKNFN